MRVVAVVKLMQFNLATSATGEKSFSTARTKLWVRLKNKLRMIRQRLCIMHTQIKARKPKSSEGCKSMNRPEQ